MYFSISSLSGTHIMWIFVCFLVPHTSGTLSSLFVLISCVFFWLSYYKILIFNFRNILFCLIWSIVKVLHCFIYFIHWIFQLQDIHLLFFISISLNFLFRSQIVFMSSFNCLCSLAYPCISLRSLFWILFWTFCKCPFLRGLLPETCVPFGECYVSIIFHVT